MQVQPPSFLSDQLRPALFSLMINFKGNSLTLNQKKSFRWASINGSTGVRELNFKVIILKKKIVWSVPAYENIALILKKFASLYKKNYSTQFQETAH